MQNTTIIVAVLAFMAGTLAALTGVYVIVRQAERRVDRLRVRYIDCATRLREGR